MAQRRFPFIKGKGLGAFIRKHDLAWHISFSPVAAMVLVDNAVEDVVNRAWFESAISNVFPKQEFESAISNGFPKQEAHSDGDRWDRVDPESLDNEQWKSAQGGFLTTQHG